MFNLNCAICAELFKPSDEVHITSCGHMFHISCLRKWLERSKTCPQCRNKCTTNNLTRVYFNFGNLDSSRVDIDSLEEQLDKAKLEVRIKEKELKTATEQIETCKETQKKCMKTIAGLEKDLKSKSFLILSYTEKAKMLESQVKLMDDLRKEGKKLREQVAAMDGVNTLLTSTMTEAEKILNNEQDPKILCSWVAVLKRELKTYEYKKADMRKALQVAQSNLRKEIEQRKKQEERNSQLESENYQLLEKINSLESTLKNNNNNNVVDRSLNQSIGLNTAQINSYNFKSPTLSVVKEEKRSTISPTIKDNIKKIEDSSSPYLNIKSCNVLLPTLLIKNHETRSNNNTKPLSNKLTVLKISPTKNHSGTIRKSKSDLGLKYSILKKPRSDLVSSATSSGSTMKPLAHNMVFNGFGGTMRVDPYQQEKISSDDDDCLLVIPKEQTEDKQKCARTSSINSRFKTGGLRDFKLTK